MIEFPNLKNAKIISIDIETYDPDIKSGTGYMTGYIVGVAISTGVWNCYFPLMHPDSENVDIQKFKEWFNENMTTNVPKLGANIMYDIMHLRWQGFEIEGPFYDVQIAEPMLDENAHSYSLNNIAKKYGIGTKAETKLIKWAEDNLNKRDQKKYKAFIYRMPASIVEEYGIADVELPLEIFKIQRKKLQEFKMWDLFLMETRLLELVIRMKERGVRINKEEAERLEERFIGEANKDQGRLNDFAGMEVNVSANASIQEACDKLGLTYPVTANTGVASFTKNWMSQQDHDLFRLVLEVRKWEKFEGTFIKGTILDHERNGRIHTTFNQLRSDGYGTVSGRFSSSNPNLQFIPSRHPELGPAVRALFVPEEGHTWIKADYSAIEPRLSLHYAKRGDHQSVSTIKAQLQEDPQMDIYKALMEVLPGFDRSTIKTIYLGISYGMGKATMANNLKMSISETERVLAEFNKMAPYLKRMSDMAMNKAKERGFVKTILNRRRNFDTWEKKPTFEQKEINGKMRWIAHRSEDPPMKLTEALEKGWDRQNMQRAFCYKAFNSVIQGSAADVMKKAMVDLYDSGIFDEVGYPLLTVHDELDFSIAPDKEHLVKDIKHMMENCVDLTVPMNVDMEQGPNWGNVK